MKTEAGPRPYRMTARADAVAATRERIIQAAITEFWQRPTTDIALDEVARGAQVSVQTVLRHFGSKQDLFDAAFEREATRLSEQRATTDPGDLAGAVRLLVDHYEEMGDHVVRLLAEELRAPSLRRIADQGRASHRAWCRRVFAAALAPLKGVERQRRLAQLIAVCDVYTWKLLRRDSGLSRRQTEQAITELLEPLLEGSS